MLIDDIKQLSKIEDKHKIIAIEAENYNLLSEIQKDLVLNIASFQEMDLGVINLYLGISKFSVSLTINVSIFGSKYRSYKILNPGIKSKYESQVPTMVVKFILILIL